MKGENKYYNKGKRMEDAIWKIRDTKATELKEWGRDGFVYAVKLMLEEICEAVNRDQL